MSAGYCFVKYATLEEADRAIRALNNQYAVPGVGSLLLSVINNSFFCFWLQLCN